MLTRKKTDVEQYKLPKRLQDVFDRQSAMVEAGFPQKRVILFRDDYSKLARAIKQQSEGRMSIEDVRWRGLPIERYQESSK